MICFAAFISIILPVALIFLPSPKKTEITIGKVRIEVTEARSVANKIVGLIGKKNCEKGNAMLFRFLFPSRKIFWTVGMQFPINIFWIREGRIIAVSKNIPPGTRYISSPDRIDAALEACPNFYRKNKLPDSGKITY
ncbi:MAG: DUF192 domain-containing protein [Parcubacteria group bacterium]